MGKDKPVSIYRDIFEQSRDAIFVINPKDGRIVEVNPNAEKLAFAVRTNLIDKPIGNALFPSLHRAIAGLIPIAAKSSEFIKADLTIQMPDDSSKSFHAEAFALNSADDSRVCVSFRATATLATSIESGPLDARIKQQAGEIEELQSQIMQLEKMASLGGLVAGVAHEINTPLGALRSNTDTFLRLANKVRDFLMERNQPGDAELLELLDRLHEPAQVSETAVERIVRIVNSLRSYARIDKPEMEEVDINEGIESTLTLVHHDLKNRVALSKEFASLPPVQCYPNQLNQAFLNILVNASHAISENGEIRIRTYRVDDYHIGVSISDTGTGIEPELLDKIFLPGFTTKRAEHGTGLGLSIVHQIVEQHHGRIDVHSEVGKGTTINIVLPIKQPE